MGQLCLSTGLARPTVSASSHTPHAHVRVCARSRTQTSEPSPALGCLSCSSTRRDNLREGTRLAEAGFQNHKVTSPAQNQEEGKRNLPKALFLPPFFVLQDGHTVTLHLESCLLCYHSLTKTLVI